MATQTANGEFQYQQSFFGQPLVDWVHQCHRALAKASGWGFCAPLKPGMFGFDNHAMSLGHMFQEMMNEDRDEIDVEEMAEAIHNGWVKNYIFWRDHDLPKVYSKPKKKLNDRRRNKCADTKYHDLPEDEKFKDRAIAQYVMDTLMQQE